MYFAEVTYLTSYASKAFASLSTYDWVPEFVTHGKKNQPRERQKEKKLPISKGNNAKKMKNYNKVYQEIKKMQISIEMKPKTAKQRQRCIQNPRNI